MYSRKGSSLCRVVLVSAGLNEFCGRAPACPALCITHNTSICSASEIVIDSKAYQSLDDEVTEAISNLTHSYLTTEAVSQPVLTPSASAVGLAPELLLPRTDQADAVLAGHAEVKEGKAPYVVYVLFVARVASRPYTSATSSAQKPSPHASAPSVPAAWTVFRRYRDFDALNDALRKRGIVVPMSLPGKRWIMQSDDDFLSKRQAGLSVCARIHCWRCTSVAVCVIVAPMCRVGSLPRWPFVPLLPCPLNCTRS
jgi:hypothetical protein